MFGLLAQEFKTLFKSPSSISILIIPLVLLVGLGYLLPSGWIVPSSITIGIVGAVLLYFGGSIEEIKRTSFMKSVSLTRLSKFSFLATKILFSIFVSMIAVLWVLFFSWVFTSVDAVAFLATDFSNLLPAGESGVTNVIREIPFNIHWDRVQWATMLYAGIMTIVVAVSISFVFVAFAKSSLSFYLMSFGYLLAMILFGGVVMPSFLISADNSWFKSLYYLVPNYYTNNVMAASFGSGLGESVHNLTSGLEGSFLFQILTSKVDMSLMTEQDLANVQFLFESGSHGMGSKLVEWDGSMTDLIAWHDNLILLGQNTEFIEQVYGVLSMPLNATNETAKLGWSEFLGWEVARNIVQSATPIIYLIAPSLDGADIVGIIDNLNVDKLGIAAWSAVGKLLFTGKVLIIHIPFNVFDFLLNTTTVTGGNPELINTLNSLLTTIDGMFNTDHWYDYLVPWLETGVFLGIAVTFFKWS